jgi:hypothetical protein
MKLPRLTRFLARGGVIGRIDARKQRHRSRPQVEWLEPRILPALVLGNILNETYDDIASLQTFDNNGRIQGNSFDDIGRIATVDPVTGIVTYGFFSIDIKGLHIGDHMAVTVVLPAIAAAARVLTEASRAMTCPELIEAMAARRY